MPDSNKCLLFAWWIGKKNLALNATDMATIQNCVQSFTLCHFWITEHHIFNLADAKIGFFASKPFQKKNDALKIECVWRF